jgi:hypothetical protein
VTGKMAAKVAKVVGKKYLCAQKQQYFSHRMWSLCHKKEPQKFLINESK